MYTLGVNLSHHSSIALLKNNEVLLFIHEERLNRKKYFQGMPFRSLDLIKNYTTTIDHISVLGGPHTDIVKYLNNQGVVVHSSEKNRRLHHMAHAAAGFYLSGMDNACVVVIDGAGEMEHLGVQDGEIIKASETTSFYSGVFPFLACTHKNFVVGYYNKKNIKVDLKLGKGLAEKYNAKFVDITTDHDIGWKYATVTSELGFGVFGEGKTMGLSGYGANDLSDHKAKQAYKIQRELEEVFIGIAGKIQSPNLILSGGCALNILGNAIIKRTYPNINIFVDPVAADGTIALGAAAYYFYKTTMSKDKLIFTPYHGPDYKLDKNYIYECARKYSI